MSLVWSRARPCHGTLNRAPRTAHDSLNSDVRVHAVQLAFTPAAFHQLQDTPKPLLDGTFTLVLDCTDNPATRHFLNAYAAAHQIPLVSGGAVRAEGTVGVFNLPASDSTPQGPCYACVFPPSAPSTPPPIRPENASEAEQKEYERLEDVYYERLSLSGTGACADEGVIGILCGVVGIGMASEAMRVLLGTGESARRCPGPPTLIRLTPISPCSRADPAPVLAAVCVAVPNDQDAVPQTDLSRLRHLEPGSARLGLRLGAESVAVVPRVCYRRMARLVRSAVRAARSRTAVDSSCRQTDPSRGAAGADPRHRHATRCRVRHRERRRQRQ